MIYDSHARRLSAPWSDLLKRALSIEGAVLGLFVVLLAVGGWIWSRPSDASIRIATLENQAAAIKRAAHSPTDLASFPEGSVCTGQIDDGLRNQLTNALMNSGLSVDTLDISAAGRTGDDHPLMAYHLVLKGSGTYDQAMRSLDVLNRYRPRLFLDTLSLRNQTSSVDLDVEGRLFCRWKS